MDNSSTEATKRDKYKNQLYLNGFVSRQPNKRIQCMKTDKETWCCYFTIVRKKEFFEGRLEEVKSNFNFVREYCGTVYTMKELFLTEESMELLVLGFVDFKTWEHTNSRKVNKD